MGNIINEAFRNKGNNSLLAHKLEFLENACQQVATKRIDGLVAEAGVYKGGSARIIATAFPKKTVHLFDSFEGMLEDDKAKDDPQNICHKKGNFSDVSLESVQGYLDDRPNCVFHKGWFPETAKFLTDEKFCFVHLDMDYYQSTKHGIEIFWPRLNKGGIMVIDDWEWIACPGVKQAIFEYFTENIQNSHTFKTCGNICSITKD